MATSANKSEKMFNMVRILRDTMEIEVKKAVTESLVQTELASFEKKIRAKIEPLVKEISFTGIDTLKDNLNIRDELHVFLHWAKDRVTSGKL